MSTPLCTELEALHQNEQEATAESQAISRRSFLQAAGAISAASRSWAARCRLRPGCGPAGRTDPRYDPAH